MALNIPRTNITGRTQKRAHPDPETYTNGMTIAVGFEQLSGDEPLTIEFQVLAKNHRFDPSNQTWKTVASDTIFADGDVQTFRSKFILEGVPDNAHDGIVVRALVKRQIESTTDLMYSLSISGR